MNKKFKKLISSFSNSVNRYIRLEYNKKYYRCYFDNPNICDEVISLITKYYLGGNTVPYTAGQVVDFIKSKYFNQIG